MKIFYIFFLFIIYLILAGSFAGCQSNSVKNENTESQSIIGKWEYQDCTIKNTRIYGFITFYSNGTFLIDIDTRDDYPARPIKGKFNFNLTGSEIKTNYHGYGLDKYFFIESNILYFSDLEMLRIDEDWHGSVLTADWKYQLKRVE